MTSIWDQGTKNDLYKKIASIIIVISSVSVIMSVPIELIFIAMQTLPSYDAVVGYALARLIVGFVVLGFGIVLFKFSDWDNSDPRIA